MAVALIIGLLIVYLSQLTESTSVEVRLANSTVQFEGRLEVYYNGTWGTVCDDFFDNIDATVACKSVGPGLGLFGQNLGNKYGSGTGRIWLDDLQCNGSETNIGNCRHNRWGSHDCVHDEDISIQCYRNDGSCPPYWRYYNGNCFYTSSDRVNQTTARSRCLSMNADLASISNQEEMDFVESISPVYWNRRYASDEWFESSDYWFGLYKVSANATRYAWYDSNPSTYRNWASDEPNQHSTCVRYTRDGFKDYYCRQTFYYTCKKVATSPSSPSSTVLTRTGTTPPPTAKTTTEADSFVTRINCTACLSPSVAQETSPSSAFGASSNGDTGLIIGIAVGVVLLLLLLIIVVVVVIVVIRRKRRRSSDRVNNAGNLSIVSTPNMYGTNDVGNSFPLDERPTNQADMGYEVLKPVYSATPVYAEVRREPTATSAADKDDAFCTVAQIKS